MLQFVFVLKTVLFSFLYNIPLHVKAWYFWLIAVCVLFSLLLLHIFLLPMLLCKQQIDDSKPSPFSNMGFLWLASIHQSIVVILLVNLHSIVGRHRLIATIFVLRWLIINFLLFLFILHFFLLHLLLLLYFFLFVLVVILLQ